MPRQPNPAQAQVLRRLEHGLPPTAEADGPVAVRRVVSSEWGREGTTILFHRFLEDLLAPELWRVYADGRTSQH